MRHARRGFPSGRTVLALAAIATMWPGTPAAGAAGPGSPTLDSVRARGHLQCGVAGSVAGFSLPDEQGVMRGIDANSCRAIAAAVFGDPAKVTFVPLTTKDRFRPLQAGDIDVLARNTTWTLSREASLGLLAAFVNLYDTTSIMVRKSSGIASLKGLEGTSICVQPATSTEFALADAFRAREMRFTPIVLPEVEDLRTAFLGGQCDGYAADATALAAFRLEQGVKADDFLILSESLGRDPLAVLVRAGDDRWFNIVRWTFLAMVGAETLGINSRNVDATTGNGSPEATRLLGADGDLGKVLGLTNSWAADIIRNVGNYGEIWERSIAPLGIPRGPNELVDKGGLQTAPPLR